MTGQMVGADRGSDNRAAYFFVRRAKASGDENAQMAAGCIGFEPFHHRVKLPVNQDLPAPMPLEPAALIFSQRLKPVGADMAPELVEKIEITENKTENGENTCRE